MKKLILVVSLLFTLNACEPKKQVIINEGANRPKNVILMIGDGMGISQISAAMISNKWTLNLERCTHIGLIKTYSANKLITESAAAATAFACGEKTYNGAIGVSEDTSAITNMFELAHQAGFKTGLVATSSIVHATPAAFYAHQDSRKKYENIALDLINSDIDAFAGGGLKFFTEREDGRNLINESQSNGFNWVDSPDALATPTETRIGYLGAPDGMPKILEGRGDFLKKGSMAIVDRLNAKGKPFMIMIEGSQIDWGGHDNDGEYIRTEMKDFDECIGSILNFAEKDKETLVIITADHETGGFSITGGIADSLSYGFTSPEHTPVLIPVFAFGPGSENFSGIYENKDIFHKIKSLLNF